MYYLWRGMTFIICMIVLVIILVRLNKCSSFDYGGRLKHTLLLVAVLVAASEPWMGFVASGSAAFVLSIALLLCVIDGIMPFSTYKNSTEFKETEIYAGDFDSFDTQDSWYIRVLKNIKGVFK